MTSTVNHDNPVHSEPPQDTPHSTLPIHPPRLSLPSQSTRPRTRAAGSTSLPLMVEPPQRPYNEGSMEPKLYMSPPISLEGAFAYRAYRVMQLVVRPPTTSGKVTNPPGPDEGELPQAPTLSSQGLSPKFITDANGPAELDPRRPPPLTMNSGVPLGGPVEPKTPMNVAESISTAGQANEAVMGSGKCQRAAITEAGMGKAKDLLQGRHVMGPLKPTPTVGPRGKSEGLTIPPMSVIPYCPVERTNNVSKAQNTEQRIPNVQYHVNTQTPATRGYRYLVYMPNTANPNIPRASAPPTQNTPLLNPGPPKMGYFSTALANTSTVAAPPTPKSMGSPEATRINSTGVAGSGAATSNTTKNFTPLSSTSPTLTRPRLPSGSSEASNPVNTTAQINAQSPAPPPSTRGRTSTRSRAPSGRRRAARRGRGGRPPQASQPPAIQMWVPPPPDEAGSTSPLPPSLNPSDTHTLFIQQMRGNQRAAGSASSPGQADTIRVAHTMDFESRLPEWDMGAPLAAVRCLPAAGKEGVGQERSMDKNEDGDHAMLEKAEEAGKNGQDVEMED